MSEPSGLPTEVPVVSPETEPYWNATAEGRLVMPKCVDCATLIWYPKGICPNCGSTELTWIEASGHGVVYTFTVNARGSSAYRNAGPYVLAYVELDEGPRVMTNVVGCDPQDVHIGQSVVAVFDDTGAGNAILRFRPDGN